MSRLMCVASVMVLGALAGAGCGGGGKACPAPAAPAEPALADPVAVRVVEYEREACACRDVACATAAEEKMSSWAEAHQHELQAAFSSTLTELQLMVHVERINACRAALVDEAEREEQGPGPSGGDSTIAE